MRDTLALRSWTVPLRWLQVASIVTPLVLAAIAGAWLWRAEYRHAEETVTRNALLVAQFSLRVLSSQEQLLRHADGIVTQLEAAPDDERLAQLFADLVAADPYSRDLALVDADGRVVVSNRGAAPQVNWADRPYFQALRDQPWPVYVDRRFLQPDGENALVVAVRRAGPDPDFDGILVTAVEVEVLAEFLRTMTANGEAASLLRQDGLLLIRHQPMYEPIQLAADLPVMQVLTNQADPLYEATAVSDGSTRLYATLQLPDLPYYASFGMPVASIRAAWLRDMLLVVAVLAAATAIALLAVRELNRRVQARLDAETLAQSRMAADYREMLFRELNHRVKNNLQLVESLLRLRSRGRSEEIREILGEVALRVGAIGEVHAELSNGSGAMLDLGELLERLTANPALVPPERAVEVHCSAEPLTVPVDQAIAVALIAVEAVTNAIKHAFPNGGPNGGPDGGPNGGPNGGSGRIDVALVTRNDQAILTITDNGIGMTREDDAADWSGLKLMDAVARKINGAVDTCGRNGTKVTVTFARQPPLPTVAAAA